MKDFQQKIIDDEGFLVAKTIDTASVAITRPFWTNCEAKRRVFRQIAVFDDGSPVAALAFDSLGKSKAAGKGAMLFHLGPGAASAEADLRKRPALPRRTAALFFADCRSKPRDPDRWLSEAQDLFATLAKDRRSFAVVCALLPEIDP